MHSEKRILTLYSFQLCTVGYVVCCTVVLARQCARFQKILDIDRIGLRDLEDEAKKEDAEVNN